MKLPLARLHGNQVVAIHDAPPRTPRTELLRMWDLMTEDERDQALLAMEAILARDEVVQVPTVRAGKR